MDSIAETKKLNTANEEDLALLVNLAEKGSNWKIRKAAIEKLDADKHPELLARIASNDFGIVRQTAVERLSARKHTELLIKIATEDPYPEIREVAVERLKAGK